MSALSNLESDIPLDLAQRAHAGTSFVPEQRGSSERSGYASTLTSDYANLERYATTDDKRATLDDEFTRYRAGYRARYLAHLVVLPSQRAEPAEIVHDEPDCAASMGCLCACHAAGMSADEPCDTSERRARMITDPDFDLDPEPVPAPRRIFNTYHAEAMARRAARFQTMHRRAIAA